MLMPPKFVKAMMQVDIDASGAASMPTGDSSGGTSAATGSPDGGPAAAGVPGMSGGMQRQTFVTRNGLIRNRYVDVTDQVRRMPVGMVVVVDQAHVQDFLTAFANARLRVQTTQVHWQHLRDNIKPTGDVGGSPGAGPGVGTLMPGGMRPGDTGTPDSEDDARGSRSGGGKFGGRGAAGMGMPGLPNMPPGMQGGRTFPGMPPGGPGMMVPGMPGMMLPGMGSRGFLGTAGMGEEAEDDMNLVELAVYGIASLYERFPPKKEQAAPADPAAPPAATPPAAPPAAPAAGI
jgi:hypothetical protein